MLRYIAGQHWRQRGNQLCDLLPQASIVRFTQDSYNQSNTNPVALNLLLTVKRGLFPFAQILLCMHIKHQNIFNFRTYIFPLKFMKIFGNAVYI